MSKKSIAEWFVPDRIENLNGLLAFHSYNRYGDGTSRLFVFDFRNNVLTCLGDSWKNMRDPMNAHFSPDGRRLVFMGVSNTTDCWDCFLHELGSSEEPVNLTASLGGRNEDPKFTPCGSKIVFKHEWKELVETDESGNHFSAILSSDKEIGMPFYMEDGEHLLFSKSFLPSGAVIEIADLKTGEQKQLYGGYYPIAEYGSSFVFAGKSSHHGTHDQIYRGFADGREPVRLAFNMDDADTSDPFPVGDGFYFVSSTRGTPRDIYKLFLADANSGAVVPLSEINPQIGSNLNDLGACFWKEE